MTKKKEVTSDQRIIMISRAFGMGGINAVPAAVELMLRIIDLVDLKGESISMKDVTDCAIDIDLKARERHAKAIQHQKEKEEKK